MSSNITVRLIGMLLFASAGFLLGYYLAPQLYGDDTTGSSFNELILPVTFVGALFGLLATPYLTVYPLRAVRKRLKAMPAADLVSATLGLFVGLVLGALISWPLSNLPDWVGRIAPTLATLLFASLGLYVGLLRKHELLDALPIPRSGFVAPHLEPPILSPSMRTGRIDSIMSTGPLRGTEDLGDPDRGQAERYLLVDTSAIIDGRIADISKTGFLDSTLLVPRFVLNELQHIADSSDAMRRARGRRGLDILNRLQKDSVVPVQISEVDAQDIPEVDGKLVKIARIYRCSVLTTDFNLNRVAEIQGVRVLNINELANAVKPVVLPGEEMSVQVMQEGKS